MIEITEEYLDSSTATLLVKAYRELKVELADKQQFIEFKAFLYQQWLEEYKEDILKVNNQAHDMRALCSRLIHTIRSGVIAASNVEAMTEEAKRLGVYK